MLLFDILKKFFGWVDETPKKRKAVSFSFERDFVNPKRQRYCNGNIDKELVEIVKDSEDEDDDDDDDIRIISNRAHSPIRASSRLNGACRSSVACCSSPFSTPKSEECFSKPEMGYFDGRSERRAAAGVGAGAAALQQQCSTLSKTYQLRGRNQYEELLQNFLPRRIDVIRREHEDKTTRDEPIEVIDLEKSSSLATSSRGECSRKVIRTPEIHRSAPVSIREKKGKVTVIALDDDKKDKKEKPTTTRKAAISERVVWEGPKRSVNVIGKTSTEKRREMKQIECVNMNSLRDQLSAKAVIGEDFVPQVTKRYNERIERRHKEAEELKKMTCVLSKHNRLAREAALEKHLARSMRLCEVVLEEVEELEEAELPALTEEMLREVKNAMVPRPPDQVLVEGFGLRITRKDIHTLADLNWLNDEVINFYMNLLIARSGNDKYPKVHAMNTFFYPKLISGGHSSLKRWTRKIDIFAQHLLVVPVHLGIHWCMAIVDFRDKSIRYYDSMGGNNQKCLSALRQYLEDESLDKKKQPYDTGDWKLECAKNIPLQMNGSDCGVFSCMFAEYICANRKITFTQQDMPYFRNKMVYEILTSKLL